MSEKFQLKGGIYDINVAYERVIRNNFQGLK
jgi:hypothetical protein